MLTRLTPSLDVWYNPLPEARFIICCTRDARRPIFTAKERATSVLDVAVWQIPPAGIDKPERFNSAPDNHMQLHDAVVGPNAAKLVGEATV